MNMSIEDMKEYKRNAIEILKKNTQYATAKATEEAFDLLIWFEETSENLLKCFDYKDTIDVEEVVRCKDCKVKKKYGENLYCSYTGMPMNEDDFCSLGERESTA